MTKAARAVLILQGLAIVLLVLAMLHLSHRVDRLENRADKTVEAQTDLDACQDKLLLLEAEVSGKERALRFMSDQITELAARVQECCYGDVR